MHVIQSFSIQRYIFDHHDIDVWWWTTYSTFVAVKKPSSLNDTEMEIRDRLQCIGQNPTLAIGQRAIFSEFDIETFVSGENVSSLAANGSLLSEVASRLFIDEWEEVERALSELDRMYGGIKVSFTLPCDNDVGDDVCEDGHNSGVDDIFSEGDMDEDGGDFFQSDYGEDIDDDVFTDRIVTVADGKCEEGPRYKEMINRIKEMLGYVENCDEGFYNTFQKEVESQTTRAMKNVFSQQKPKARNEGSMILSWLC